jgi:CCR4-NOT complex subunit CAF16
LFVLVFARSAFDPLVHNNSSKDLVEVTVDMDVLGRLQLLRFLEQECAERNCIILYATHIFDGLANWMTHIAFVSEGRLVKGGPVSDFPELHRGKVLHTAAGWLRAERDRIRTEPKVAAAHQPSRNIYCSRQMAFYR